MDLIEKSLEIALNAYKGQKDKAGETYILHPLRLMAKMETRKEMAVALLHDVIEDSNYGAEDLRDEGIPDDVIEAIEYLTKEEGENYDDFIDRTLENPLAAKVKKADIEDNINILRIDELKEKDLKRVEKYHRSWHKLNGSL